METLERSAPPAWHPDPVGSGGPRWWDGEIGTTTSLFDESKAKD